MSVQNKPIILVDGSSYLYRAFYALPALTNSSGFPTGAIYGMVSMLRRLLKDYQPDLMAVIFDSKEKTFRDDLYADYKATRQAMPTELTQQIEPLYNIIRAMGIPLLCIEGVEADDVIGTLCDHTRKQMEPLLISTSDKDMAQLVDERVSLINTMTDTLLTPKGVLEKFGVPPQRIVDYLTLVGDASDNIPGVPKVGPKTAAKWLQTYHTLDKLIENAHHITGKIGENLRQFIPQIPLTKSLVTIKCDVSLPIDFSDLTLKPADKKTLIALYKEMEFKNWLAELLEDEAKEQTTLPVNYHSVTSETECKNWLAKLHQSNLLALTLYSHQLDVLSPSLLGMAFAVQPGEAIYIPISHDQPDMQVSFTKEWVLNQLKPLLENAHIQKIMQNAKPSLALLAQHSIDLRGLTYDCMIESYVLDSIAKSHDLETLALKYLGKRIPSIHDAALSADVSFQIHQTLWPRISREPGLKRIFETIEMPLLTILSKMEQNGVLIDPLKLKIQEKELEKRLVQLEQEAFILAEREFNINSPKQLQDILFSQLKLPIIQKTPKGQASTADHVLQELALEFALPKIIIEYRSLSKLMSTYTKRLVEQINPNTGRIHTSYHQAGTTTGRLSSSDPNLQNIPIRTKEGRRIRQAFIAPKGFKILSADYSQIELRLMAHISGDANLIQAFQENGDIHRATAAEIRGISLEEVTLDMRREAKAVNFGLLYGMSAFGLSRQLGIDRKAAQEYIDRYFTRYPLVKAYMDKICSQARQKGYIETLWGRRLYVPDITASQIARQKAAQRIAINAPLQGSAADIIKLAMIRIDEWLTQSHIPVKMMMQVHDELVFEVAEKELEVAALNIKQHMISVGVDLCVPLIVTIGTGDNWDEASNH